MALGPDRPRRGAEVLVVGPHGGVLKRGRQAATVARTLLTVRSIEFDALLVADERL